MDGHFTAMFNSHPAVFELLIREHPLALCPTSGDTPQQMVTVFNRPAPIISLLTDTTAALAERDYAVLAARVHGNERTINIAILGPRLAARGTLLLCIKHG